MRREPNRQIVVAARFETGERKFQFARGFDEFSGEEVGHALDPMRDPCLAKIRFRRDVGEEGRRLRFHRRKVASHIAAGPQAIVRRQSLEGVVARRDSRALAKASVVSGAPKPRAAMSAAP